MSDKKTIEQLVNEYDFAAALRNFAKEWSKMQQEAFFNECFVPFEIPTCPKCGGDLNPNSPDACPEVLKETQIVVRKK